MLYTVPINITGYIPIPINTLDIIVKSVTLVESDPKAPFSIGTILRCLGGRNAFPWIAPLYPWSITYDAKG